MNQPETISFVGIGAQKCASTWVYRVLSDHPEVFVSDPKELDFFSYFYDRGFQWYHRHFDDCLTRRQCGEISPSYFYDPSAPARLAEYNPQAKIIVTIRDPIDRAFSNHLHEIRLGRLQGDLSFEAGLKNNPMYLHQSRYATHIKSWLAHFPAAQLLVLVQEEIKRDPASSAVSIYEFLGIDRSHQPQFLDRQANVSYAEKVKGLDSGLKAIGKWGRRLGLGLLVDRVRELGVVRGARELNREHLSETIAPMQGDTRLQLVDYFADEVAELTRLLGREQSPWKPWLSVNQQHSKQGVVQ